ncbi:uncharacterized protein (DUF952 family) [Paenibacillus cellulosilyticus]|uniref:Uncharacterized protein (DUF952 family) n=1 Tax=Paenibacillus cellulosilyticus TaxID=375489 RepID=A0A2V2YBE5_9BACL|nr:DUF952 domain-containing protein [Paenibacillus cellulosilyticus]PWV87370.1 uncharacterized protein (DUF952 family) [Paenibacillus cellulosilyticus]QKS44940.1 DUF952 domain-containing protein [Paenibacillus cellulosilyticus]
MAIIHITTQDRWKEAKNKGHYDHESIAKEGFIHCSSLDQVLIVADNLYKGQEDLLLLLIEEEKVKHKIIWEDLYNLNELYPHIYGVLNLEAVINTYLFKPNPEGTFQLPKELK